MRRTGRVRVPLAFMVLMALSISGCALTGVSTSDEIRLGQQVAAEVESRYRTYEDPTVTRLGRQLAAVSSRPNLPYRFRVIDQTEVNAFALPGGPVYVTSGLMRFSQGRTSDLAAVLGHEVAHIARRHASQQIQRQAWLGLGIEILTRGTARDIATIAANLEELGYSRNQERDADTYGAVYLTRLGMDPIAMVNFLKRLEAESGRREGIAFLRTHPTSAERVGRLQNQIDSGEIRRLAQQGG